MKKIKGGHSYNEPTWLFQYNNVTSLVATLTTNTGELITQLVKYLFLSNISSTTGYKTDI